MKYDVFISYSSKDQKIAEGICGYLESNGYRCFVAYRDIPRGVVWAGAIADAIDESQMMVVVFSKDFNISPQTDRELELAAENNIPILTYRISDDKFTGTKKFYLKNLNWIDAFPNPEEFFEYLIIDVSKLISPKSGPSKNHVESQYAIHNNEITLNIVEGFNINLRKDYRSSLFLGNVPVLELLNFATYFGDERTNSYLPRILIKKGTPLAIMTLFSYNKNKKEKKYELERDVFNAIISEINDRYKIRLRKVSDEVKMFIKRHDLTDFAVYLDSQG